MAPLSLPTMPTGWLRRRSWLGRVCALPATEDRTRLSKMPCPRSSRRRFRLLSSRRSRDCGRLATQHSILIQELSVCGVTKRRADAYQVVLAWAVMLGAADRHGVTGGQGKTDPAGA